MTRNIPLWLVTCGIVLIAMAMVVGPFVIPAPFFWVRHSTSEQAAQHLAGAWIMRAGFLAYGLTTLIAAKIARRRNPWVRAALALFGLGLIATAIWSHAPIVSGVPVDMAEDRLHSIASGIVGASFAGACAAWLFAPGGNIRDPLAWSGLLISVLLPLGMGVWPGLAGLIQRGMFVFSFVFVIRAFR